jgi:hypothetical protein
MVDTQLCKLFAVINDYSQADLEPVVSRYHAFVDELIQAERKVREEIQQYGVRPFYLKGRVTYLLELKHLLDTHPFIQHYDRREQYVAGYLLRHATDPTRRFKEAEVVAYQQVLALMKKVQKRGLTDRLLSQLSKSELSLLALSVAAGFLVNLQNTVADSYEDLRLGISYSISFHIH